MFLKHSSSVKKVAGKIKQHRIKDKSTSVYERNYTATEMNQQKFKAWGFTNSSVFWERSSYYELYSTGETQVQSFVIVNIQLPAH